MRTPELEVKTRAELARMEARRAGAQRALEGLVKMLKGAPPKRAPELRHYATLVALLWHAGRNTGVEDVDAQRDAMLETLRSCAREHELDAAEIDAGYQLGLDSRIKGN